MVLENVLFAQEEENSAMVGIPLIAQHVTEEDHVLNAVDVEPFYYTEYTL